ncbi:unnamed protein product [Brugia timori]|uniref:Uncharacterized protein n=1 Tax=Brugia timori TaxID=42155 RepID=A0A3P7VWM0_9BILA|nr:unnamed protein product [Brugia timori]
MDIYHKVKIHACSVCIQFIFEIRLLSTSFMRHYFSSLLLPCPHGTAIYLCGTHKAVTYFAYSLS